MRKPGILTFFFFTENQFLAELISTKIEEHAENKTALSQTDGILSPFSKSDVSMKQHKACTFKWALSKIAIFRLIPVFFSCTVLYISVLDIKCVVIIAHNVQQTPNRIQIAPVEVFSVLKVNQSGHFMLTSFFLMSQLWFFFQVYRLKSS